MKIESIVDPAALEEPMRIPEIQDRLRKLALELGCDELNFLAGELSRRTPPRRADNRSTPMSKTVKDEIRRIHNAEPNLSFNCIASALNINPGRVSETLRGFRK